MSAGRMHVDEVDTDVSLVGRLLAAQFPQWADLAIEPVHSDGTDNAIYRLGDDMAVRLPSIPGATGQVDKEHRWLPRFAPLLPLAIPVPLAKGAPGEGYPWHWSVHRWLDGENATIERIADPRQAATELAQFIPALQRIDPTGGPPPGPHNFNRGEPLAMRDPPTRAAIATLHGTLDADAVIATWEAALQAPAWRGPPVWIHGDLQSGNLLAQQGRLSAVIDFGSGRGRSRMRLDNRVESSLRRNPERISRSVTGRWRDLGARSRLGIVLRADRASLLPEHQPCTRRHRPTRDR
jgi:aminoglycoside phosphotransferase (APT) family kinase protein